MLAILEIQNLGYKVSLEGEQIKLTWQGEGNPDPTQVRPLLQEIRTRKQDAIRYLKQQGVSHSSHERGKCESCPACGYWDGHGSEPFCFFEAVYLGRSALAQLAEERQKDCPLKNQNSNDGSLKHD